MRINSTAVAIRSDVQAVLQVLFAIRNDVKAYDLLGGTTTFTDAALQTAGVSGVTADEMYGAVLQFNKLLAQFDDAMLNALLRAS